MESPTILLVDDVPTNLMLLHEFLIDTSHPCFRPYTLLTARDGMEAITLLESKPEQCDVVLMDIMMPRMDGLEVLRRMKKHEKLLHIPVIFQTAKTSSNEYAAGIEAGAYYYLTKPVDQNHLLAIVRSALEACNARKKLQNVFQTTLLGMPLIHSLRMECRTHEEARHAAILLAQAFPDPTRAVLGILELLYNAIEHGNLGLTYDDKTALYENGDWEEEVQHRHALPQNANKKVVLEFQRIPTEIRLTVTDQGNGFDWTNYLQFDPKRLTHTHGRGIAIANNDSFDTLEYLGCGNQVVVTINLQEEIDR